MNQPRLYVSSETSTRKRGRHKAECSRCGDLLEAHRIGKQSYCLACHAQYMRLTRPKHSELPDEARRKANVRSVAKVALKRGQIEKKPCEVPGCTAKSQMHHKDYSRPKDVTWFCRQHHLDWHRIQEGKRL